MGERFDYNLKFSLLLMLFKICWAKDIKKGFVKINTIRSISTDSITHRAFTKLLSCLDDGDFSRFLVL